MIDVKKLLAKILSTNLVIETGSVRQPIASGSSLYCDWTWKKWKDGSYDLWCVTDATTWSLTAVSGKGYYTSFALQFPAGFNAKRADFVVANRHRTGGGVGTNALITFSPSNIVVNGVNIYIFTTLSFSAPFSICIYAHGRL